ncbi:MAG: magnesium transporter CorA family protein [Bacteroidales bacterium]|nr:magnesium transporter CorA family protein [Bacteroidales bacterium]
MITYWQIIPNGLLPLQSFTKGAVINVVSPSKRELDILRSSFSIPEDFISDVMDVDERSRMEVENGRLYLIYRIPVHHPENGIPYTTIPLGMIFSTDSLIVISNQDNDVLAQVFSKGIKKQVDYDNKIELLFHIIDYSTMAYLKFLKQINLQTNVIEQELEKSTRNRELHRLLSMEKCLVYFNTSLRSNELLIAKLRNSKYFKQQNVSEELVEDVIIEIKQAFEMTNVYSDILSGMMDAFASVISNNLNNVMKQLTIVTIILMIPTLIASFYGMNVPNFLETSRLAFGGILLVSVLLSIGGVLLIRKRKWM